MRISAAESVAGATLTILLAVGCASTPPPPPPAPPRPALAVEVLSEPVGAQVLRGDQPLGRTPIQVDLGSMAEVLSLRAEESGTRPVERRIRVRSESDMQVTFRFGAEPTALARALGLGRVTVFDYSGGALFDVDRATVKPEAVPLIERQAELLAGAFAGIRVFACGHTDRSGGEAHNLELSLARAQAVADILVARGIDRARIAVQGFGWQYPVADDATSAGRVLNRRAEVLLPDE